ncbi:hypothetical protein [Desulfosarcina ovata]|uniref:Uncharacterized protein n=1 Tax=Desulfosarcina ovata subsp. ovata TaxID=2752305 RepID=A0A5K8AGW7_9BACT|nr:hypothetical protein [Desulfosarcina ovata]BBO91749.1 hypothetical protein DSCOOX_49290 [Desulfosarcina ovata subsp. ovata]
MRQPATCSTDGAPVASPSGLLAWLTGLTWKADKPEPDKLVPVDGVEPVAVGRPAEFGRRFESS